MLKNKLTPEQAERLTDFLNHGSQPTSGLLDLVSWWDRIPYDEPDPSLPQYPRRETLVMKYLNKSRTKTWAWDGMQNLLVELGRRREPVPQPLKVWVSRVAQGKLPRPGKERGRKREWERDFRILTVHLVLRRFGYSWEEAVSEIADLMGLSFDAVKVALRKANRDWPITPKSPPKTSR